jgi:hypothetical protein
MRSSNVTTTKVKQNRQPMLRLSVCAQRVMTFSQFELSITASDDRAIRQKYCAPTVFWMADASERDSQNQAIQNHGDHAVNRYKYKGCPAITRCTDSIACQCEVSKALLWVNSAGCCEALAPTADQ